jgi:hypothetical protein
VACAESTSLFRSETRFRCELWPMWLLVRQFDSVGVSLIALVLFGKNL